MYMMYKKGTVDNCDFQKVFLCYILQIPTVTEEQVKVYLQLFNQELREKCKSMYYAKFLQSIRFVKVTDFVFICGRVSAEMSKKCVYTVDLKLDEHGVISECQCECAAGMGPDCHCKHVTVILFALTKVRDGIITKETCTQVLQTFHQAKRYTGSPVKMEDMTLRTKSKTGHGLLMLKNFDPRPAPYRNRPGYRDFFRSIWLNSSARNPPIRQLYYPANMYAITNDHDYFTKSPEELFLDEINVTSLTVDQQREIERRTRGQSCSKEWREERLLRLQSSMFGRICTATDRTDFPKLASSLVTCKELTGAPIMHGKKYEGTARRTYSEKSNSVVVDSGIVVSLEMPYVGCSPDGLIGEDGIIEIKCPYTAREEIISAKSVPYLSKNSGGSLTLDTNHLYYYQVMGTLFCTDRKWCDFVVWTFKDMKVIRIERDESFIVEMKQSLSSFFHNFFKHVLLEKKLYKQSEMFLPDIRM